MCGGAAAGTTSRCSMDKEDDENKCEEEVNQDDYISRRISLLNLFLPIINSFKPHNTFLLRIKYLNEIHIKIYEKLTRHIEHRDHKMDFHLIILIRFLFLLNPSNPDHQVCCHHIENLLSNFGFWPNINDRRCQDILKHCFWSENHIFMYLTSGVLFSERARDHNLPCSVTDKEIYLLKLYLRGHIQFHGVYEVLSHVYLPYTIASLLNLYDFSTDSELRDLSSTLLNIIMKSFVLCTNIDGVSTFTPSTRHFNRTQTRPWGHNINSLIYLLTGKCADELVPTPITGFLLTSSWTPSKDIDIAFQQRGSFCLQMSHNVEEIRSIYSSSYPQINPLDVVPFYWSAGLVTHPDFIDETKQYQIMYNLTNSPGIGLLGMIPQSWSESLMESYEYYSGGQNYTGVILKGFKSLTGRIILSSFEMYNVGLQSYQQIPWMGNIAGLPIWTQPGGGVNNFSPAVRQEGPLLVCAYVVPSYNRRSMLSSLSDTSTYLYWPSPFFDSEFIFQDRSSSTDREWVEITKQKQKEEIKSRESKLIQQYGSFFMKKKGNSYSPLTWRIGVKSNCYVGVCCTEETIIDNSPDQNAEYQLIKSAEPVICPRIKCTTKAHTWICAVGDSITYPCIEEFMKYCESIRIESNLLNQDDTSSDRYTVKILQMNSNDGNEVEINILMNR